MVVVSVPSLASLEEKMMSTADHYDVLVIGSGEAGKYLAWTLSKDGHRTALVERKLVGGSCPNVACLPSKNIIHAAKVASYAARAASFGVFGAEASELMAVVQTAMLGQLPFTALRDALFTHPTAAEGLTVLLATVR
jgi:pyruvate/2-oxoglutarate dehydrogenase complex dihydrolipoamide dehydrogenase (E3) component